MHIISSSRKTNYILFIGIHISSFQINRIYPLHRNTHYVLYSEMPIVSISQINTIRLPLINTMSVYILYNTIYSLLRNVHYIQFSKYNIISSSHKDNISTL